MAQKEGAPMGPEITCQEVTQWASAYLDEYVDDERNRRIALHLAICGGCETYVKQIGTVRDTVGLLPRAAHQLLDMHRLRQAFLARTRRRSSDR